MLSSTFARTMAVGLLCSVSAGPLAAACSGISDPPASAGLERVKTLISEGRFEAAFERFEISDEAKKRLAEGLEAVLPESTMSSETL